MPMMKTVIHAALILVFCTAGSISAANDVFAAVSMQLSKHPIASGEFTQSKKLPFLDNALLSSGHFSNDAKGLTWSVSSPVKSDIRIGKDGVFVDGNKIRENNAAAFIQTVFHSLMNGNHKAVHNYFTVTTVHEPPEWTFALTPKSKAIKNTIESIVITGENVIGQVRLLEKNGAETRIEFENIKTIKHHDQ